MRRWPLLITDNEAGARLKPNEQFDLLSRIEKNRSTLGRSADRLARVILSCMASPFELHREVKRGNTRRVSEHLTTGAEINAKDRSGDTPLMHALRSPDASAELVEFLLESGGEVATTLDGTNCYMASIAIGGGHPIKLALVLDRGADLYNERKHGITRVIRSRIARSLRVVQPGSVLLQLAVVWLPIDQSSSAHPRNSGRPAPRSPQWPR